MQDRDRQNGRDPEIIVEYVPRDENRKERPGAGPHFYYYRYARLRPLSPLRLALWGALGLAVLLVLLAIGSTLLFLAAGTALLYALWRRLTGIR